MAYTINRTDGTLFATVADGTINTTSSLVMVGKNYAGYGESLNENFYRLLESHANGTAPGTPQQGQLWYDTSLGLLKVWSSAEWKDLGSTAAGVTGPENPVTGDIWYDTTNSQLHVYDGDAYVLIGPSFSSGTGTTGSVVETVTDGILDYVIIKVVVSDAVVAIISKSVAFIPVPTISGFTSISPGYNLSTDVDGQTPLFSGTATNAITLNNIPFTDFLSSVGDDSTSGTLAVENDAGLTVGLGNDAKIEITGGNTVVFSNETPGADILFSVSGGTAITIDGTTGKARVGTPTDGLDIANKNYVTTAVDAGVGDGAAIKIAYEGEADTNAYNDAAVTKLAKVESFNTEANSAQVIDFTGFATTITTLNANISLTSLNLATGLRHERIFIADGSDRTVTLNASWHAFGEASPIVVPAGKALVISLTAAGATEASVYAAAVLEN